MDSERSIIELKHISKSFAGTDAVRDVSLSVRPREVLCLLGDNGAGKSTLIKMLSGVYQPSAGEIYVDGSRATLASPRAARSHGIATVHQSTGTIPLMSVARNFFLGAEPTRGWRFLRLFDSEFAERVALSEIKALGLRRVTSGSQLVGSLSGGERQGLAIARAMYFGARVLILDEPTSALGVREATMVMRLVDEARNRGVAIIFITHNARHALSMGDRFVVLNHGRVAAAFKRGEKTQLEILALMAGGEELDTTDASVLGGWSESTAAGSGRS